MCKLKMKKTDNACVREAKAENFCGNRLAMRSMRWFLIPVRVCCPNSTSINLTVFVRLTSVSTDRPVCISNNEPHLEIYYVVL